MVKTLKLSALSSHVVAILLLPWVGYLPRTLAQTPPPLEDACNPPGDPQLTHYIVGYGSLMETESRQRTTPETQEVYPVLVRGFERLWGVRGSAFVPTTFLGAIANPQKSLNGITYPLKNTADLLATDQREGGYCRRQVPSDRVHFLAGNPPKKAQFWIYTLPKALVKNADANFPIVQSYVDIFIHGCLQLEQQFQLKDFAAQCITSTGNWSPYWVNDRLYPRRPFIYQPEARAIDQLLQDYVPGAFAARKIE